ncbi:MAG: hydrogenase iron-sulfur subunit [Chloroflexi bacterium]|nr:hydrogenase iron-sulfur subunit [Chloroflexota bacterium]
MKGSPASIGVILCPCNGLVARGIDLEALAQFLQANNLARKVIIRDDLCEKPGEIGEIVQSQGWDGLVIGACGGDFFPAFFKEGEAVAHLVAHLREESALAHPKSELTERAQLIISSLVNRLQGEAKVGSQYLKPRFGRPRQRMGRRALLHLIKLRYDLVPQIDGERCVSDRGCRLCLSTCPTKALAVEEGRVVLDKDKCEGCGMCLPICPTRAFHFPTFTPQALDSALAALMAPSASLNPRLILFACQGGSALLDALGADGLYYPANLLPLSVPCLGMLSPYLILRALDHGASGVGFLACSGQCRYGYDLSRWQKRLGFAQEVASQLGLGRERLRFFSPQEGDGKEAARQLAEFVDEVSRLSPVPGAEAVLGEEGWDSPHLVVAMASKLGLKENIIVTEGWVPLGQVAIDASHCTACGLCAAHCPTSALRQEEKEDATRLIFNYADCVACYQCSRFCPERAKGAIKVERVLDLQRLGERDAVLMEDTMLRCQLCGEPFVAAGMARQVSERLLAQGGTSLDYVTRYCPRCRLKAQLTK